MRALNVALVTATLASPVLSWGIAGHEIVATIAQIHLHPSVLPVICDILNYTSPIPGEPQCHLAPIAGWADKNRFKMRWSSALHYINGLDDYPSQSCAFPGPRGWAGPKNHNVLGGMRNTSSILENYADGLRGDSPSAFASEEAANEALKFLVHFFGDMHMPLHLVGRDRGGNSVKVRFGGRLTNLHSTWDGLLIAKAIRETAPRYSHPLPSPQIEWSLRGTIYDSYVRQIVWEGILDKWANEVDDWLSCPSEPEPITGWQRVLSVMKTWMTGVVDPGRETDDSVMCPYHWASVIHPLNCELIWPKELDEPPYNRHLSSRFYNATSEHDHEGCHEAEESLAFDNVEDSSSRDEYLQLDTPEYAGVIRKRLIIEKLLAQAGIRLAAHLNWLFAAPEDVGTGLIYRRHFQA